MKKFLLVLLSSLLLMSISACAQHEKQPDTKHILVFHTGTDDAIEAMEIMASQLPAAVLPTTAKEGYVFSGWYTDEELQTIFDPNVIPTAEIINLYAKFTEESYSYKVTVRSNVDHAVTFTGGATTQIITQENPSFEKIDFTANIGYTYLYYEVNGIRYASNTIELPEIEKDTEVVVYTEYATDELPIVNINTNGLPITSKEDYVDMSFSIENCQDEAHNFSELAGGIRLRGNSTMGYSKKPYRIKLDKKVALFGLDKAKSWVLLAEYLDPSALHNYTAFSLAHLATTFGEDKDGLQFTPSPYKVNVYLNGEFVGLYTLCEQVQENEGRMDIEVDEITADMTDLSDFNFFICMDYSCQFDVGAIEDVTYFKIPLKNDPQNDKDYAYFELKYPEKDQFVNDEQFENFLSQLKEYAKELVAMFNAETPDAALIKSKINLNSLIDYMIIDQIMGERDHEWKSFNMYYVSANSDKGSEFEKGKLSFGPIWDYDWALYTDWIGTPNEDFEIVEGEMEFSNIFFQAIARDMEEGAAAFGLLKERFQERFLPALDAYIESLPEIQYIMAESLKLNQDRWYADKPDITRDNIQFLNDYLDYRREFLANEWALPQ